MDTVLQFLSNYTNVLIIDVVLTTALLWIAARIVINKRNHRKGLARALLVGQTWGNVDNTLQHPPADAIEQMPLEKVALLIRTLWRGGMSIDEVAHALSVETDLVVLELARANLLPGEVIETIENPMVNDCDCPAHEWNGRECVCTCTHSTTHPSGLTYDQWREGIALRDLVPRQTHHSKTRRLESPLQVVRYDSAGYMD